MQTDNPVAQALETEVAAADAIDPSMDLRAQVEKEFKTREHKNIAIELLTAWNRKPTWK